MFVEVFFMCVSVSHRINQNEHPGSLPEIFSLFAPQTKFTEVF